MSSIVGCHWIVSHFFVAVWNWIHSAFDDNVIRFRQTNKKKCNDNWNTWRIEFFFYLRNEMVAHYCSGSIPSLCGTFYIIFFWYGKYHCRKFHWSVSERWVFGNLELGCIKLFHCRRRHRRCSILHLVMTKEAAATVTNSFALATHLEQYNDLRLFIATTNSYIRSLSWTCVRVSTWMKQKQNKK